MSYALPPRHFTGLVSQIHQNPEHNREFFSDVLPNNHGQWSGGTTFCDHKSPRTPFNKKPNLVAGVTWINELACLALSIVAVGGIIAILAVFAESSLPNWPFSITLNTLIALITAVANTALAVVLSSGISQLKWIWFKQKPAPIKDMELFDEASRGSWGAVQLLGKRKGGPLGSFGAIITIVALMLGPFSQQIATYPSRTIVSSHEASISAAMNYTGALPGDSSPNGFVPILPMKAAAFIGLFAESEPSLPRPLCPTGNCTYPTITTLGVCSRCIDLTPFMTRYCSGDYSDLSRCGWQVPQGAKLTNNTHVFSMTSLVPSTHGDMPYSTIIRLIFMGTESAEGKPLNYNPWASQCSLEYCAQKIEASVTNGKLVENVTSTIHNSSVLDTTGSKGTTPISLTTPDNITVSISEPASLGIRSWFTTLFTNGSASRNSTFKGLDHAQLVVVNLTVGISSGTTYFDTDVVQTFYWDYYEKGFGLPKAMSDLATAMTTAFRSFNGAVQVPGVATRVETYVKVQWAWLALPLFVVTSTAIFLALAILSSSQTKTELWKGSALAMLFYGLDNETKIRYSSEGTFSDKIRAMGHVKVRLDKDDNFGSVLRAPI
ncbi:hypothetical protein BGZ60DRAFT_554643 [Tricladium varicosporioides]|nr:hypothetical protein BGZ60DRAFT_554643 [Hymenoscyphus varicosporioides]